MNLDKRNSSNLSFSFLKFCRGHCSSYILSSTYYITQRKIGCGHIFVPCKTFKSFRDNHSICTVINFYIPDSGNETSNRYITLQFFSRFVQKTNSVAIAKYYAVLLITRAVFRYIDQSAQRTQTAVHFTFY